MQLYYNANAMDVDSLSTHSNGTTGQPQGKREGNCSHKNAGIGYKWTRVIESGPYKRIHLGTQQWPHTDIICFRHQVLVGMELLLWYNLSWSSHDSPLFTIPANVAAPQVQVLTLFGVVGTLPLIYGASAWHNPGWNDQFGLGLPQCHLESI